jgi:CDP-4-dehydro-6-deoxyglucose reductase, E3
MSSTADPVEIRFAGTTLDLVQGQTLLDALTGAGHRIPQGCRSGICHSCLLEAVSGVPPQEATLGLSAQQQARGLFLACQCRPSAPMEVRIPAGEEPLEAHLTGLRLLAEGVMWLVLEPQGPFRYFPGQFLTLLRPDGVGRPYSLASQSDLDPHLCLHVSLAPGGLVSGWIHRELKIGDRVTIKGPEGDCFYRPVDLDEPLLLVGNGTGLAPLYGILNAALNHGHRGTIHLYHGARDLPGLYLDDTLRELARVHPNLVYRPSVLSTAPGVSSDIRVGRLSDILRDELPDQTGYRLFLAGAPELVAAISRQSFLAGAAASAIHSDAFVPVHETT